MCLVSKDHSIKKELVKERDGTLELKEKENEQQVNIIGDINAQVKGETTSSWDIEDMDRQRAKGKP